MFKVGLRLGRPMGGLAKGRLAGDWMKMGPGMMRAGRPSRTLVKAKVHRD